LLIKLRCVESSSYEMQYHYYVQGFIYNLLKDSKYHYIHNKEGYKFFCFSNIFPVTRDLEKGDLRTLIISSPDSGFITYFYERLHQQWNTAELKIGCMRFRIDSIDKLIVKLPDSSRCTLVTGTPIIVRIPREKYKTYGIEPTKDYNYIYWRSAYPIELFVYQVENNLLNKYAHFSKMNNGINVVEKNQHMSTFFQASFSFFQKFKFKKQVSTRVLIRGSEHVLIGTVWEFTFNAYAKRDMIHFALDTGLGERNSLGFGFMNLQKNT